MLLKKFPGPIRGALALFLLITMTTGLFLGLCFVGLLAALSPSPLWQQRLKGLANRFPGWWADMNDVVCALFMELDIQVNQAVFSTLSPSEWYLLIANHQNWVDILVLYRIFNRRIPVLKFFMKRELKWVPVVGQACMILDYPFVYRYTKKFLKKHPEKAGADLRVTQKACEKFKTHPTVIVNFLEGTRYTRAKHERQANAYHHLLSPKAGGIAYVLSVMGDCLHKLIDVTLVYDKRPMNLWQFLCARRNVVKVHIAVNPLSPRWRGDYQRDVLYRRGLQKDIRMLWTHKDQLIESMEQEINGE